MGHWFGNLPMIKSRFHLVVVAIIVLSLVPVAVEFIRHRKEARLSSSSGT
jgi:membrane-associated protein